MSTYLERITIDRDGDIYLVTKRESTTIQEESGPADRIDSPAREVEFQVSSGILVHRSRVWRSMLSGPFLEGQLKNENSTSPKRISVTDDDTDAFHALLLLLHGSWAEFEDLRVGSKLALDIVVLADKYDCTKYVGHLVRPFLAKLELRQDFASRATTAAIFAALQDGDGFRRVTRSLVLDFADPLHQAIRMPILTPSMIMLMEVQRGRERARLIGWMSRCKRYRQHQTWPCECYRTIELPKDEKMLRILLALSCEPLSRSWQKVRDMMESVQLVSRSREQYPPCAYSCLTQMVEAAMTPEYLDKYGLCLSCARMAEPRLCQCHIPSRTQQ